MLVVENREAITLGADVCEIRFNDVSPSVDRAIGESSKHCVDDSSCSLTHCSLA